MIEVAVVFDPLGRPIYWHCPLDNSIGAIPDSRKLWDILWDNRHHLGGVAHTHPWVAPAIPSITDHTTFQAIEAGLGRWCLWPVVTLSDVGFYVLHPETKEIMEWADPFTKNPFWPETVEKLRQLSHTPEVDHGGQRSIG
jgi:hypothetical protein